MQIKLITPDTNKTLDQVKADRLDYLNDMCNKAILSNFTSTVGGINYSFSNDEDAQKNFDKAGRAFDKGFITSLIWTAYDSQGNDVRIALDNNSFETVYVDHLNHIQSNISNYRDSLQPRVQSATSIDEVNSVIWEYTIVGDAPMTGTGSMTVTGTELISGDVSMTGTGSMTVTTP